MNLKYDSYLFSELVCMFIETNNTEIKNELLDRMNFCEFNKDIAECFIDLEKLIINYQNLFFDKPFYNKFYWLKNKKILFKNNIKEMFMINTNNVTKKTIPFSDCLCLLDEATYIFTLYNGNDIEKSLKEEIAIFCEDGKHKFIRKELAYRFMLCYDKIKNDNSEMPEDYFYKIDKLINNELRIINLCKWIYPNDRQNSIKYQWKPYTSEYYNYYK